MADKTDSSKGNEDTSETKAPAREPSLDTAHEQAMATLDSDDSDESEDTGGEQDNEDQQLSDDDADASDTTESEEDEGSDSGADADDTDDSGEDEADESATPPAKSTTQDQDEEELTPPEHDTDVTKPGKYKTKFVDEEGKEYYVEDMDQLPDDFEPRSQKDYGKSIFDLGKKQSLAEKDQAEYDKSAGERDRHQAVESLKSSWNEDIDRLTKNKTLPQDTKERDKVIRGTYEVMDSELRKGRVLNSWEHAHEIYQYRQSKKQESQKTEQDNEDKKNRGAKVMGSGTRGAPAPSRVRQAPPSGVSLDDIQNHILSQQ